MKNDGIGSVCSTYEKIINDDGSSMRKREDEKYLEDIGVGPGIILKRF